MRRVARANVSFLPPGPWVIITEAQWEALCKFAKIKDKLNWSKAGVDVLTLGEHTPIETYKHLYPDLYEMLKGEETSND